MNFRQLVELAAPELLVLEHTEMWSEFESAYLEEQKPGGNNVLNFEPRKNRDLSIEVVRESRAVIHDK